MNYKWLFLYGTFLVNTSLLAQDPADLLKKLDLKSPDITKNIDGSCMSCKGSVEEGNPEDLFCKDLYGAICVGDGEKPKYAGSYEAESDVLVSVLRQARDKASKEIGFNSFKDHAGTELKKAGIELSSELSDKNLVELLGEPNKEEDTLTFKVVEECRASTANISANNDIQNSELLESMKNKLIETYSLSITNFMNTYSSTCGSLKYYIKEFNTNLIQKCTNFSKIRAEAISLYRLEGAPEYKGKVVEYIKKNLLPPAQYSADQGPAAETKRYLESICSSLKDATLAGAKIIAKEVATSVSSSKPVVEHMIGHYYTNERISAVSKMFDEVKSSIKEVLPQITKDEKKRVALEKSYDKLELASMKNPEDKSYKKDEKTGLKVLDETLDLGEINIAFSDASLSYFTELNAFYNSIAWEKGEDAVDTVHMMPFYLKLSEENPYTFISTLAHEAAHKIGPELSRYNRHDLTKEWASLVDCYRQSDSIKLISGQEDETIADYISSEVLVKYLEKYPKEERRKVFTQGMHDFCLFSDADAKNFNFDLTETHPDSILRINGIYGANPNIKQALGCKENSYRECKL